MGIFGEYFEFQSFYKNNFTPLSPYGSSHIIDWTRWNLTALHPGPRLKSFTTRFFDALPYPIIPINFSIGFLTSSLLLYILSYFSLRNGRSSSGKLKDPGPVLTDCTINEQEDLEESENQEVNG
ncbi:hypothetical protein [Algoriphagus litoralis]|uniref:hypothetical protein n=1 Tax=Algoriphagus litoralis TaxID=2202829 RepID=UPI0013004537|nr:hypothetical protein [Algoriphagus litoralis]